MPSIGPYRNSIGLDPCRSISGRGFLGKTGIIWFPRDAEANRQSSGFDAQDSPHYGNEPFLQAAVDAHPHEGEFPWVVEVVGGTAEVSIGELVDLGQGEAGLIQGAEPEVDVAARNGEVQ